MLPLLLPLAVALLLAACDDTSDTGPADAGEPSQSSGDGDANGDGDGDGSGNGNGNGDGDGSGNGSGDGDGDGDGDGGGGGNGDGDGDGDGGGPLGGDCTRFDGEDSRLTPALAATYLDKHNAKRAQYCLEPLRWDDDLAAVAQAYARMGAGMLPHNDQRNAQYAARIGCVDGCPELGENIAWHQPWDYWPPETLVDGWLGEEDDAPGCNHGGSHYTQMVQQDTTAVGCGTFIDSEERLHLVCNYLGWQYGGAAFPDENCSCGGQAYPPAVACVD